MATPTAPEGAVKALYTAAACSRNHASAARPQDGLVAFASGHFVALWKSADEHSAGVHQTLPGHRGDVTALRFAQSQAQSDCFVSGDAQGEVRVWREKDGKWTTLALLTGHSGSISAVEAVEIEGVSSEKRYLVFTGGSDATLRVWTVSTSGEIQLIQTVALNGKIPLSLAITFLPSSSSYVLAVGGTETRIQLYTSLSADRGIEFRKSLSLEGHTDWVRCLSFTTPVPASATIDASASTSTAYDIAPGEVLLASGSQDNYIRLWRISRRPATTVSPSAPTPTSAPESSAITGLDALDAFEEALASSAADDGELRVKAHDFTVAGDGNFSCASEAVLLGHDAWVTGLNWAPTLPSSSSSASSTSSLRLLSASADRSLILWTPLPSGVALPSSSLTSSSAAPPSSSHASVWTSTRRFGEFTSSTNLGFFGALWGLGARTVLASGWGGSWHVWREAPDGEWVPQVAVSGHLGAVRQVAWEGEGEYLLSASADMSARLHAPWRRDEAGKSIDTWHELGRPQIHGYPLASVAFTSDKRLQFVSGADEKIVRVFDAPKLWVQMLKRLSGVAAGDEESRPMAANVPPLGLSNRAIASPAEADNIAPASSDPFDAVLPTNFTVSSKPPLEEQLLGSLLWPEVEKLYGHAFELVSVAAAHSSPLIASACKATAAEQAVIRLYSTQTWQPIGALLEGHALTITKLAFSPAGAGFEADRWLLSVSRDRTWRLYERDEAGAEGFYRPVAHAKSHARIIWDAAWGQDASFFATASRDKTVKVWTRNEEAWAPAATLKFDEAATSVASAYVDAKQLHVLAVGLENGEIRLFTSPPQDLATWTPQTVLGSDVAHVLAVTTLSFSSKRPSPSSLRLASGSEDQTVRIFDLSV
ncbi:Elongator subunit ELP2 [Rhodotorula paludigena]|uniref:Elongator subunit ELP2 n=1 Tax=Rhodotorula paludigena TaxID=86838 RepID=UPI003180B819